MSIKSRKTFGGTLEAILSGVVATAPKPQSHNQTEQLSFNEKVPINLLVPGKYQPRHQFDALSLNALAESIKTQGIIQPLIVRKQNNVYEIIAGERRFRAAQLAGLNEVPIQVVEIDDQTALAYGLIENLQREDLNPLEEAEAYQRLIQEFQLTHEAVGRLVGGRSRVSITQSLRLLNLAEEVKQLLRERQLEVGHAKILLALGPFHQVSVAKEIIGKQLSVRETERLVKRLLQPTAGESQVDPRHQQQLAIWSEALTQQFSLPVSLTPLTKGGAKVVIICSSFEELRDFLITRGIFLD